MRRLYCVVAGLLVALSLVLSAAPWRARAQSEPAAQDNPSATPSPVPQSTVSAQDLPITEIGEVTAGQDITPMSEDMQRIVSQNWPGFEPQGTLWTLWTPSSPVTFTVGHPPLIKVRVSEEAGLNPSTARFALAIDGVIHPEQPALAVSVLSTTTYDLIADIGTTPSGSLIRFRINRASDNAVLESPVYGIERRFRAAVPLVLRQPPAPQFVASASACAAQNTPASQLISQTVFYTPTTTLTDSWFYAVNPNPNGVVRVQLRGYSAGGQLQVWYENPDCTSALMMRPFGFGSDPVVTVSGVPQGRVYFRVASSSPPPPFGIAWQAWAANNNPCTPWSLPSNTTLRWTARNPYDFFALNFATSDIIRVSATYPQTGTQIQLRSPISSGCDPVTSTTRILPNFGVVSASNAAVTFTIGVSQAGNYFLRVSNGNLTLPGSADYQIYWEPVRINRGLFTTNPDQPQGCQATGTNTCLPDSPGSLNRP
ncbi:MAG: hypothetical protein NZ693_05100, partial [Thermoflexales bacterium]|nr:hypothetical protein [Thermoflexales bacterium]